MLRFYSTCLFYTKFSKWRNKHRSSLLLAIQKLITGQNSREKEFIRAGSIKSNSDFLDYITGSSMSFVPIDAICSQKASILQSTLAYLFFPSSWHCDHSLAADTWNTWERQSRRIVWQMCFTPTKLIITDAMLYLSFKHPLVTENVKRIPTILLTQWPWIT